MGRMSIETRERIITIWKNGTPMKEIQSHFREGKKISIACVPVQFNQKVQPTWENKRS